MKEKKSKIDLAMEKMKGLFHDEHMRLHAEMEEIQQKLNKNRKAQEHVIILYKNDKSRE